VVCGSILARENEVDVLIVTLNPLHRYLIMVIHR